MASNYKFSNEEMAAIKAARRETKDKRADARLKALELRAEGMELSEVSQATGFHAAYVSQLVAKYRDHGLEAISGNHYGGNHRNMRKKLRYLPLLRPGPRKVSLWKSAKLRRHTNRR